MRVAAVSMLKARHTEVAAARHKKKKIMISSCVKRLVGNGNTLNLRSSVLESYRNGSTEAVNQNWDDVARGGPDTQYTSD